VGFSVSQREVLNNLAQVEDSLSAMPKSASISRSASLKKLENCSFDCGLCNWLIHRVMG
jgi:hypothetical protein